MSTQYSHHILFRQIDYAQNCFRENFSRELNLVKVPAPNSVMHGTGINDFQSHQTPIIFPVADVGARAEIVRSLGKWKRWALKHYGFSVYEGLYTDMHAIRQDEHLDNSHSMHVDQWDWEMVIQKSDRNLQFLQKIVRAIYQSIRRTEKAVCDKYPKLGPPMLPEKILFIHSDDLESMYPGLAPEMQEDKICEKQKAVFLIGLGYKPQHIRSTDHDDWSTINDEGKRGLNGDILFWHQPIRRALEISSMGIRVDKDAMLTQLKIKKEIYKKKLFFHKQIIENRLTQSIGGGIGQSRLTMYLLRRKHIGEVNSSIWPDNVRNEKEILI